MRILIEFIPIIITVILIKSFNSLQKYLQISNELTYAFIISYIVFLVIFVVRNISKKKKGKNILNNCFIRIVL